MLNLASKRFAELLYGTNLNLDRRKHVDAFSMLHDIALSTPKLRLTTHWTLFQLNHPPTLLLSFSSPTPHPKPLTLNLSLSVSHVVASFTHLNLSFQAERMTLSKASKAAIEKLLWAIDDLKHLNSADHARKLNAACLGFKSLVDSGELVRVVSIRVFEALLLSVLSLTGKGTEGWGGQQIDAGLGAVVRSIPILETRPIEVSAETKIVTSLLTKVFQKLAGVPDATEPDSRANRPLPDTQESANEAEDEEARGLTISDGIFSVVVLDVPAASLNFATETQKRLALSKLFGANSARPALKDLWTDASQVVHIG